MREFLLENVSRTGGHIGANLGVVELTIALHYCYDTPHDILVFDTGHQGYVHKIITGRAHLFPTLNSFGGMSRFLSRAESPHDEIEASHAGTSISLALGMARALKLQGSKRRVVCVIGDGSLVEGMAQEALDDALVDDINLTVVANVNGYAISPASGRWHEGFREADLIDGHDLEALLAEFPSPRAFIGVRTWKGCGWPPADAHPYRAHFLFPFERGTGKVLESQPVSYAKVVADALALEMVTDDRIVAITPSTLYAVGMEDLFVRFPDRSFDPGMAEQHAMGMAAGMALKGLRPVIAYQSTFAQRAFDQIFHDICAQGLPVVLLLYRSGFAGYDSPTHHGVYDLAWLGSMPGLQVYTPSDTAYAVDQLKACLKMPGPTAILMPYGPSYEAKEPRWLESPHVRIFVSGDYRIPEAAAARIPGCDVHSVWLVQPLLDELEEDILSATYVVVWEERTPHGGLHERLCAFMAERGIRRPILRLGLPLDFFPAGSRDELLALNHLDEDSTVSRIQAWLLSCP